MPALLRPLTLLALLLVAGPAGAAVDPGARCIDAKLGGSAAYAKRLLSCHAKAVKKGAAVDPRCLERADAKLAKAFGRAEAKGGCQQIDDLARTRTFAAGLAGRARFSLAPVGGPTRCTATQLKAGGTRVAKAARAYGKLLLKGDDGKFQRELEKLAQAFDRKHAKAVKAGDCEATEDATRSAGLFDAGLDALYAAAALVQSETLTIASDAEPAETPGSDGADPNAYPQLVTQFGGTDFSLNNVTYTRYFLNPLLGSAPDAVLILVPGFEGGALTFKMLAENAVSRALENGMRLEVWAYDRRSHQLEDLVGQDIAEAALDAQIALDWYFGEALGLTLHPELAAGPNRRAVVHGPQAETAFIANWTELVFSRDLDSLVEVAQGVARSENVYLGGHSAGTGFTARYAATDFSLTGAGAPEPGYAKLRGLVLLEGGGGSTSGAPPTEDELDRIEDKADGGLFAAVRDDAPRCVDGTPCPGGDADCTGRGRGTCTEPTAAYSIVPGLLNPYVLLASEAGAIQAAAGDADEGRVIILEDQGAPGNNALAVVPELGLLGPVIGNATAAGALGAFIDDDGLVASLASFVSTSVGARGPANAAGLATWLDVTEAVMPPSVLTDNGPAPSDLPTSPWGVEVEATRLDRMTEAFFAGGSNFTDWYYPSSGLGTTGGIGLDSSALSVGRDRRDIANLTQAAEIDVPVIAFGGTNGLTETPSSFVAFAESLDTCAASADCDGTARVVDDQLPDPAFPTFGEVAGGFEVHLSEGYAHVDIVTAEDDADNRVIGPLVDFILRNNQ